MKSKRDPLHITPHNNTNSSSSMEKRKEKMISKEEKKGKGKKIKQRKQIGGYDFITNSEEKRIKLVEPKKEKEANNISDSSHHHEEKLKADYIYVRARRGQATDSHSLAERARREKIRGRLELLQSLVPGCDKITGKAQVLDEIIKYVRSLQNLAECLAAKLASVNSTTTGFEVDPLVNTQASDQTSSLNGECCFEFPQFSSFADTSTTITPAFAATEMFQDDGDLFSGLNDQSQNIDIRCLHNMSNF